MNGAVRQYITRYPCPRSPSPSASTISTHSANDARKVHAQTFVACTKIFTRDSIWLGDCSTACFSNIATKHPSMSLILTEQAIYSLEQRTFPSRNRRTVVIRHVILYPLPIRIFLLFHRFWVIPQPFCDDAIAQSARRESHLQREPAFGVRYVKDVAGVGRASYRWLDGPIIVPHKMRRED